MSIFNVGKGYNWGAGVLPNAGDSFPGLYGRGNAAQETGQAPSAGPLPSLEELKRPGAPEERLKAADRLAQMVKMQADGALRSGQGNAAALAGYGRQVMDAVAQAVQELQAGGADLAAYKEQTTRILSSLSEAADMAEIHAGRTGGNTGAMAQQLSQLDEAGRQVASWFNTAWGRAGSSAGFRPDPTKLVDMLV